MERKLIKQGKGGFTIYLPKKWIDQKGLEAGGTVSLIEKDADLIVQSSIHRKKEIVLDLSGKNKQEVRNLLTHVYRKGFDTLSLTFDTASTFSLIKKLTADLLLGFEITNRHEKGCKLENLAEPREQKYEVLVQRLLFITKELAHVLKESLGAWDRDEEMEDLKKQGDKFIIFCLRTLTKELHVQSVPACWEFLKMLLHVQHHFYYLYYSSKKERLQKSRVVEGAVKDLTDYLDQFVQAVLKKKMGLLHGINEQRDSLIFEKYGRLLKKSQGAETVFLAQIKELLRQIQLGTSPLFSIYLEYQV